MGKDHLDDKIKSRLHSHEEFIDKNELWAAIQGEEKKRRFPLFWWMFGLIGICLVTGLVWTNLSNNDSSNNITKEITDSTSESKLGNSSTPSSIIDNSLVSNDQQNNSIKSNANQFLSSSKNKPNTQNASALKTNQDLPNSSKVVNDPKVVSKENSINIESSKSVINTNEIVITPTINETRNNNDVKESLNSSLNYTTQNLAEIETNEVDNLITIPFVKSLYNSISIDKNDRDINLEIKIDEKPIIQPVTKTKISLDLSLGGGQSLRSFKTTKDSPYAEIRSSNENSLEFLNATIGIRYNFNNHWYGKVGFDYGRFTERLKFNVMNTRMVKDSVPTLIEVNLKGDTTFTKGLSEGSQVINTTWEYYNYYHSINIPIKIGYHIPMNKFGLLIEAGPVINLGFYQDINVLDEQGVLTHNPNTYKSNIGFGLETSLGISYNITKSISLYAAPSFRYNFSNTLSSSKYGSHKFSSIYLKVGSYINF